jgi:hypothetical protein
MTRCDFFGSRSCSISPSTSGTTCQDRPYLSVSQPQRFFAPPAESFSQYSSTSCCVLQAMKNDTAGEKLKLGPPLSAMNSCPSSSKLTESSGPSGAVRMLLVVREFGKIDV